MTQQEEFKKALVAYEEQRKQLLMIGTIAKNQGMVDMQTFVNAMTIATIEQGVCLSSLIEIVRPLVPES